MESTLIDRSLSNGLMATMPADGMGSSYPLHELDQGYCVRRFHHKVPVVRENAVRDEPQGMSLKALTQYVQEGPIIGTATKDWHLPDAPVNDVEEWR